MDAMCYALRPRYDTVNGVILDVEQRASALLVTVQLPCGGATHAPANDRSWRIGQPVEILLRRSPLGGRQGVALRRPVLV